MRRRSWDDPKTSELRPTGVERGYVEARSSRLPPCSALCQFPGLQRLRLLLLLFFWEFLLEGSSMPMRGLPGSICENVVRLRFCYVCQFGGHGLLGWLRWEWVGGVWFDG